MGMILTRLLADGRKILSETTRGVTTTQVLNCDGEVMLTRVKQVSRKQVPPPKVRHVGFFQQEQQDTFITIKKAVCDEINGKSYSILDRVYRDGVRLGERHLSSNSPYFSDHIKDIFVNEGGQLVHKSKTQIEDGVRSFREYCDLKLKCNEIDDRHNVLRDKLMTLRTSYKKNKRQRKWFKFPRKKTNAYQNE